MNMFHVKLLPQDLKEQAKLDRRRALENERRERIFNPKQRMIGIDEHGIRKQIEEKTRAKDLENANEKRHYQNEMSAVKVADDVEKYLDETKRRLNEELNLYWKTRQTKESRREHYLSLPLKIVENKNDLGVSSGQIFEGEDINKKVRKELQTEQQRNWLFQQMSEKKQTTEEVKLAEKIYHDCLNARESRAISLEELEKKCKREIYKANLAYNEALARENEILKNVEKNKEHKDKLTEIFNAVNSDFLTENPEVSQSNLGQNKVLQYLYKGMSEEVRLGIRQTQLKQIQENKINMEADIANKQKWDQYYESVDNLLASKTQFLKLKERENNKQIMQVNKMLSREKKIEMRDERRKATSNYSTAEFLSKFNISSR